MSFFSSPFHSCFRPSKTTENHHDPPPPLSTTYIYHTDAGTISLAWSRSILGRSLDVHLHHHHHPFHLPMKPFTFWKKRGSKKLSHNTFILWNFSKVRFGSGPEPISGFSVAVLVDNELILQVGDVSTKYKVNEQKNPQVLVLRRDHVDVASSRNSVYATTTRLRGKEREIEIECDGYNKLVFSVDGETVLEVKPLKWKFRGSERVETDGIPIQITWDVHDWVFENDSSSDGHASFMFKFEENVDENGALNLLEFGKSWSSSSISVSSSVGSFGGASSVMEWSSVEENELVVPLGFSLLVYAWRR